MNVRHLCFAVGVFRSSSVIFDKRALSSNSGKFSRNDSTRRLSYLALDKAYVSAHVLDEVTCFLECVLCQSQGSGIYSREKLPVCSVAVNSQDASGCIVVVSLLTRHGPCMRLHHSGKVRFVTDLTTALMRHSPANCFSISGGR